MTSIELSQCNIPLDAHAVLLDFILEGNKRAIMRITKTQSHFERWQFDSVNSREVTIAYSCVRLWEVLCPLIAFDILIWLHWRGLASLLVTGDSKRRLSIVRCQKIYSLLETMSICTFLAITYNLRIYLRCVINGNFPFVLNSGWSLINAK